MTTADLANEIYIELGQPSGLFDTGYVNFWLISNIGNLNLLTQNCFVYDSGNTGVPVYTGVSGELVTGAGYSGESGISGYTFQEVGFLPDLTGLEKGIYKEMFDLQFYNRGVTSNLGAAAYSPILELKEADTSVRLVNKNEVAKTYAALANQAKDNLKELLNKYNQLRMLPGQIAGDDAAGGCCGGGYFYGDFRRFPRTAAFGGGF